MPPRRHRLLEHRRDNRIQSGPLRARQSMRLLRRHPRLALPDRHRSQPTQVHDVQLGEHGRERLQRPIVWSTVIPAQVDPDGGERHREPSTVHLLTETPGNPEVGSAHGVTVLVGS